MKRTRFFCERINRTVTPTFCGASCRLCVAWRSYAGATTRAPAPGVVGHPSASSVAPAEGATQLSIQPEGCFVNAFMLHQVTR
jgi:hypothetical protein